MKLLLDQKVFCLSSILLLGLSTTTHGSFPEQGKFDSLLNDTEPYWGVHKSLFAGSTIQLTIQCNSLDNRVDDQQIRIKWLIRKTPCFAEYAALDFQDYDKRKESWKFYLENPEVQPYDSITYRNPFYANATEEDRCDTTIKLKTYIPTGNSSTSDQSSPNLSAKVVSKTVAVRPASSRDVNEVSSYTKKAAAEPILVIPEDGIYLLVIFMESKQALKFSANVHVEMKSDDGGYLSAVDWPLLHFYEIMCCVYLLMSFVWIILCANHWRDLLRVQLWIFAVAFLGMIEVAVFLFNYQSINTTGVSVSLIVLLAEIISCAKRTLSRLLVLVVSIGFGIVKPRLGTTLHRLVAVGFVYFMLASIESSLRILHPVNGPSNRALMANVALSVLDAGICWWIFHSLLNTTRTLRLRRNLVKLSLYRNFSSALIFAVITSVGFMIWSIKYIKTAQCLQDWKDVWIDEAYWHLLFSIILIFIMILWRPTNNNQRYSFSPLMDATDDEDDEEDLVVNESFGNMKLRQKKSPSEKMMKSRTENFDDYIPADIADGDLPAIDSDEELMTSKFELSKMQ